MFGFGKTKNSVQEQPRKYYTVAEVTEQLTTMVSALEQVDTTNRAWSDNIAAEIEELEERLEICKEESDRAQRISKKLIELLS